MRLQKRENSKWGPRWRGCRPGSGGGWDLAVQPEGRSWPGCRVRVPAWGKREVVSFRIWPLKEKERLLKEVSADMDVHRCKVEKCGVCVCVCVQVSSSIFKNSMCVLERFFFCCNLFFESLFHSISWGHFHYFSKLGFLSKGFPFPSRVSCFNSHLGAAASDFVCTSCIAFQGSTWLAVLGP